MEDIRVEIIKDSFYLELYFEEEQKLCILKKIMEYIHFSDDLHYYIFFGYEENNLDIQEYKESYSELKNDHGFFKLEKTDIWNYQLISDILYNFQMASLYINKIPDLDKKSDFNDIRHSNSLFEGYVISEMKENHISILKSDDLPDWDLEKMGIHIDQNYQLSSPIDTPVSFSTQWRSNHLKIEYSDIQIIKKELRTGILSVNGKAFPEYRFGGPFLYSESYLLVPVYMSTFLKTTCKLARIDLSGYSIELFGKGYPIIYLVKVDFYRAFFYTDLNKAKTDFIKLPRIGRLIIGQTYE